MVSRSASAHPPTPVESLAWALTFPSPDPRLDVILSAAYPPDAQSGTDAVGYMPLGAPPSIVSIPRFFSGGSTFLVPLAWSGLWTSPSPWLDPSSHLSNKMQNEEDS